MEFTKGITYHLSLEEEDCLSNVNDPKYKSVGTKVADLEFSYKDFIKAIITMGMMPKRCFKQSRRAEIEFKLALVKAAIKEEKFQSASTLKDHRWLHMDYDFLANLDPSEKGAISYWIGMIFATLLAQKKFDYEYVIHYSHFVKDPTCSAVLVNPNSKSTPDLICMNKTRSIYGAFEAKGTDTITSSTMKEAYNQVCQIKLINNNPVKNIIVSYTQISTNQLITRFKDPNEGKENILFNETAALLWQYLPLVELNNEMRNSNNNEEYPILHKLLPNGFSINSKFNALVYELSGPTDINIYSSKIGTLPDMNLSLE